MKWSVSIVAVALLLAGCSGYLPSEREAYRIACEELAKDETVPAAAEPAPFEEAGLYMAKNAGCVRLPYRFVTTEGVAAEATYTVWFKRVARTWQAERAYRTPTYTATPR